MLENIKIENFKSIDNLSIDPGRFNVFIGANGSGKSNILESIVFTAAALNGNPDNEFWALRGARASAPQFMRSGFDIANISENISIRVKNLSSDNLEFVFYNDNQPFSKWKSSIRLTKDEASKEDLSNFVNEPQVEYKKFQFPEFDTELEKIFESQSVPAPREVKLKLLKLLEESVRTVALDKAGNIANFMIYSPEISFLKNSNPDKTFVEPLGHRGEGLLNLLKVIKKERPEHFSAILKNMDLIDWFDGFEISDDFLSAEREFSIRDKYLEDGLKSFDIANVNEGFFFLLFYLTLIISDYTPSFFAIDNIDSALNPKLCSKLISLLSELAEKNNKQVIITTHNPAVLDGLNLNNNEERLFVVSRNAVGYTRVNRIEKKSPLKGEQSLKLSEQFLRGYIGGLPKNF